MKNKSAYSTYLMIETGLFVVLFCIINILMNGFPHNWRFLFLGAYVLVSLITISFWTVNSYKKK